LKNTKKLIIFDLDGTVLNSITDLKVCANKIRENFKLPPISREKILNCIGDGVDVFVDKLFCDVTSTPEQALNQFTMYYANHISDYTNFFDGMIETIEYLNNKNLITGILSNKDENLTKKVLSSLNGTNLFSFIYGGDSFPEKKPSKLPIEKILKQFSIPQKQAVIIGDSPNDINAGKSAGISTIAVLYGYTKPSELLKHKPDKTITSPFQLKNIL